MASPLWAFSAWGKEVYRQHRGGVVIQTNPLNLPEQLQPSSPETDSQVENSNML